MTTIELPFVVPHHVRSPAEVVLVPMNEQEFEVMNENGVRRYAEENVRAGYWSRSESVNRSIEAHRALLPEGLRTAGHHFFKSVDRETREAVGHIWIKVEEGDDRKGFIFDLFIKEGQRGKGYGRATMIAAEGEAKSMGLSSLALHVFYFNDIARHLYDSLGYEIKSMNMMKSL